MLQESTRKMETKELKQISAKACCLQRFCVTIFYFYFFLGRFVIPEKLGDGGGGGGIFNMQQQ